jgi:hypothetical protein
MTEIIRRFEMNFNLTVNSYPYFQASIKVLTYRHWAVEILEDRSGLVQGVKRSNFVSNFDELLNLKEVSFVEPWKSKILTVVCIN